MKNKLYKHKVTENPYDFSTSNITYALPPAALAWLRKYNITEEEVRQHGFFYDNDKDYLVMPVNDGDRTVFTASRYFGSNEDHPKYVSKGYKHGFFKLVVPPQHSNVFVLVEDYLSAIKVGRYANAVPLMGSFAPRELLLSLLASRPVLRFWLDRDKSISSMHQAARARQWHPNCGTIVTALDPKDYTDEQIREYIDVSLL
jgi:hypothetical protein